MICKFEFQTLTADMLPVSSWNTKNFEQIIASLVFSNAAIKLDKQLNPRPNI